MYLDTGASEHLSQLVLQSRIWWGLAGLSLCLITLFGLRLGNRLKLSRAREIRGLGPLQLLRLLHRSDSATASLEYLMVLFPFLVIVMTIWQLAFMLNAQLFMGYSAFAAARSASVVIYEKSDTEPEGILKTTDSLFGSASGKWSSIRRAAVVATLPISPGQGEVLLGVRAASIVKETIFKGEGKGFSLPTFELGALAARMSLMTLHYGDLQWITKNNRTMRTFIKSTYADEMTGVYVNGFNKFGKNLKGEKDAQVKDQLDLSADDVIDVTVKYIFWLQVPFVGRMLEIAFAPSGRLKLALETFSNPYPFIILSETMSMKTWRKKRATTPC